MNPWSFFFIGYVFSQPLSLTAERIIVGRSVEKRIEVEKSSFGNGWRFFYAEKSDGGQVVAGSTSDGV